MSSSLTQYFFKVISKAVSSGRGRRLQVCGCPFTSFCYPFTCPFRCCEPGVRRRLVKGSAGRWVSPDRVRLSDNAATFGRSNQRRTSRHQNKSRRCEKWRLAASRATVSGRGHAGKTETVRLRASYVISSLSESRSGPKRSPVETRLLSTQGFILARALPSTRGGRRDGLSSHTAGADAVRMWQTING